MILTLATAQAADGYLRQPFGAVDDVAVILGLAPQLRSAKIDNIQDLQGPAFNLELDGAAELSAQLTLRWTRSWWHGQPLAWVAGAELGVTHATGTLSGGTGPDQDLTVTAVTVAPVLGWAYRWDLRSLESPGDALEFTGLGRLRVGMGSAEIDSAEGTSEGLVLGAGATIGVWWTGWHRWRLGGEVGGEWLNLQTGGWNNTDAAKFTFAGAVVNLGFGWRF